MADNNYKGKIGDRDTVNRYWMLRIISKGLIHLMTMYLVIFWFSRLGNLWRCNPTIEVDRGNSILVIRRNHRDSSVAVG